MNRKCPSMLHSKPLLESYKESAFYDGKSDIYNEEENFHTQNFNIFELESLLSFDFFNFNFLCRINIDSSLQLSDLNYQKLYLHIDPPNTAIFNKKLIESFSVPYDPASNDNEYSMSQIATFDAFQNEIKNFMNSKMTSIRKGILKLFQMSRVNISNISADEIRPFTHILLSTASNQLQKTTPKIEKTIQASMIKKDNQLTPMLYPFQLKNKANSRKIMPTVSNSKLNANSNLNDDCKEICDLVNIDNNQHYISSILKMFGKPLNIFQCVISHFNHKKNGKGYLYLFDSVICFSMMNQKKKFISFEDIKYLLFRKVKDGYGYEIITESFTSILFFVMNYDFNALSLAFKSFHFKNARFISFTNEFTTSLNELTKSWLKRRISNFEYLLKLNTLSGHSFFQCHLYPVMPPIVENFDDLNSEPDFINLPLRSSDSPPYDFFDMNLKENFTNYLNIMADYFFDFCNVKNDGEIVLPKWAKSKFEFIYINRKKLEKLDVTTFIDRLFGCECDTTNNSFTRLFKKPHEKRQSLKLNISPLLQEISITLSSSSPSSPKLQPGLAVIKPIPLSIQEQIETQIQIENQIQMPIQLPIQIEKMTLNDKTKNGVGYFYRFSQRIIASMVFLNLNGQLRFWIVFANHKFCYVQLSEGFLKIKCVYELDDLDDDDDLVFFNSQSIVYVYSYRKSTVYYLNTNLKAISQISLYTEQPLFTVFDDQLIYCQRECSLYKMNTDTLALSRYCLTNSKLTALASAKQFNVIVYATIDGFVHVSAFSTCEEINQYNVGFEVKNILITTCMGFILASSNDHLVALTVNGDFINQYKFDFLINNLYSLTICAGIDFIAFDTFDNEVGYFEIFYPEKYQIIKKCNSEVKRVSYDPFDNVFIVVQSNGSVELIYHYISL